MNRTSLPINEITIEDRQRLDLGDLDELAKSLERYGLIQPVVINQNKRLVSGGRRIAAANKLGWQRIDVVYRETLSVDELHELELEENVRRKEMSWQERTLNIEQIHRLKRSRNAADGETWGQRETAELLGVSVGNVNYCLAIAARLRKEPLGSPLWLCQTLADAWRLLCREDEEAASAKLALLSQQEELNSYITLSDAPVATVETAGGQLRIDFDAEREAAKERYFSNALNDPEKFEAYWEERKKALDERMNTVVISNRLHLGDCIAYMAARPNSFDHIITDIPYGIDMDMLDQNNPHGGMNDLDLVVEEHDEDENKELIRRFFPAAFACTKPSAFVITWCDIMLWQFMYDLAVEAGFTVQRWPVTWVKTNSCMNSAAAYNFTKSTEIAIVCRKPGATLVQPAASCVVIASNDEMKKLVGHPFAKPYECWAHLIEHTTLPGQLVLEPFAGRGSGVLSLLRLDRRFVACEINVNHFNALIEVVKTHYRTIDPNYRFV